MDEAVDTSRLLKEVERSFHHFNIHLFDEQIPLPSFLQSIDRRQGIRFSASEDGNSLIALGYEVCRLEVGDLLGELLHEMVHAYNHVRGLIDVTSNQYHNGVFLEGALRIGLCVVRHKTRSWGYTFIEPRLGTLEQRLATEEARANLAGLIQHLNFDTTILLACRAGLKIKKDRPKQFLIKWVCDCPPPHNSIRSGRRPHSQHAPRLRCETCKTLLRPEDDAT
jgi:hypothetical protein